MTLFSFLSDSSSLVPSDKCALLFELSEEALQQREGEEEEVADDNCLCTDRYTGAEMLFAPYALPHSQDGIFP